MSYQETPPECPTWRIPKTCGTKDIKVSSYSRSCSRSFISSIFSCLWLAQWHSETKCTNLQLISHMSRTHPVQSLKKTTVPKKKEWFYCLTTSALSVLVILHNSIYKVSLYPSPNAENWSSTFDFKTSNTILQLSLAVGWIRLLYLTKYLFSNTVSGVWIDLQCFFLLQLGLFSTAERILISCWMWTYSTVLTYCQLHRTHCQKEIFILSAIGKAKLFSPHQKNVPRNPLLTATA